jgi:hypothetical protein
MKEGLELCCKFGLRLLTVATPSKMQCINQIDFSEYIEYCSQSKSNRVCLFLVPGATSFVRNYHFMVAASRMGNLQNPGWCFSDTPFYPLPGVDDNTKSTDASLITMMMEYLTPKFHANANQIGFIACETIS